MRHKDKGKKIMNLLIKFKFAIAFLISGLMLSACGLPESKESLSHKEEMQQDIKTQPITAKKKQALEIQEHDIIKNTGIRYNSHLWSTGATTPIDIDDVASIKAVLGEIKSTDKQMLDYQSNPAKLYRYMKDEEPYLDLINSDELIEFDWYFALPENTENERITSVKHAQNMHGLVRQLLGINGGVLVKDMLAGKVKQNVTIGGQQVMVAKCHLNRCLLVIKKTKA